MNSTNFEGGIWLKWWADSNTSHANKQNSKFLGVYAILEISAILSLLILVWWV